MDFEYPVVLEEAEEDGFNVSFPDVPEALTQGEDEAEALAHAQDALETALEFYVVDGRALPIPSKAKRSQRLVKPSALSCMKLSVYQAMRAGNVRKTALARRLGLHLVQIDRLLNLQHASRIDQLEAALQALGKKLSIKVETAAAGRYGGGGFHR